MKLTNELRNKVITDEIAKKFHDKTSKLDKQIMEEIDRLARKEVPKWITEEIWDSGYLTTTHQYKIKGFDKNFLTLPHHLYYRIPSKNQYDTINITPTKKLENLLNKKKALNKEKSELKQNLTKVLFSFNTDKQLLENVPELKKYFPENKSTALIPLDTIKAVRAQLGAK